MRKKVFLISGGTGGHLFPAIALSEKEKKFDYFFLIDERTEKFIKKHKLKYFKITSSKIKFNLLLPINLIKIFFGFLQSIFIFLRWKPNLVIGFGGYTSIPSILAAKFLSIKIIIHEQNAIMGKTNRILSNLTNNVAITFPNTKYANSSAFLTGIPVRKKKKLSKKKTNTRRLFIMGGSQGAAFFSYFIPKLISNFSEETKRKIIIVQQIRNEDKEETIGIYKKMKIKFILKDFFDDIYNQLNKADLVISRCGASSLAEIELHKKFSVLFPLKSSMNNHQYHNAIEFKKKNHCFIIDENKINIVQISKKIEKFIFNNKKTHKSNNSVKFTQKLSLSDLINKVLKNV